MKLKILLALSVAGNIALLATVAFLARGRQDSRPVELPASQTPKTTADGTAATPIGKLAASDAPMTPERDDVRAFAAEMREAGWPEYTLAKLLVNDFWESRQNENRESWLRMRRGQIDAHTFRQMNEQWQDELKAFVDGALGDGACERFQKQQMVRHLLGDASSLDPATVDRLYALQKDYQQAIQEFTAERATGELDDDQMDYRRFHLDYERALKELLGEQRYADYKLRQRGWGHSDENFRGLQLSDEQFAAAAQAALEFEEQQSELSELNQAGEMDPSDYQQRQKQLRDAYHERLKQVLGEDDFLRYQQNNDWQFREIRGELRRQNLTDAQINTAYRLRKAHEEQREELYRLRREGAIKNEDYSQQYEELDAAFDADVRRALGDRAYLGYLKADDDEYRRMRRYATAWQLTEADIDAVWETIHDAKLRAQDGDIGEIARQAKQKLLALLGADRYERLKRAGVIPEEVE